MEQQQDTNWDDKDEKYRRRVIYILLIIPCIVFAKLVSYALGFVIGSIIYLLGY